MSAVPSSSGISYDQSSINKGGNTLESLSALDVSLQCFTCGPIPDLKHPALSCPNTASLSAAAHVLAPPISVGPVSDVPLSSSENPFLKYRSLLYTYRYALSSGLSDDDYTALVTDLDDRIREISGTGFTTTPLLYDEDLNVFIKDESNNVAQSHKARHLFNVMVYLQTTARLDPSVRDRRLAVASCGNAGLAAATIAAAADWDIDVCIPTDADDDIVNKLTALGPKVTILRCPRGDETVEHPSLGQIPLKDEADPTLSAFMALTSTHNSIPFSVQGPSCGLAVEGSQTLAFELLSQTADHPSNTGEFDSLYVQVGGGALGSGMIQGFERSTLGHHPVKLPNVPKFMPVQASGNAPLSRAYDSITAAGLTAVEAAAEKSKHMYPWSNPSSVAHGILDDETYDWVQLLRGVQQSGGSPIVVEDDEIRAANKIAKTKYKVKSCYTGSVGLAGMMRNRSTSRHPSIVVLSGIDRSFSTSAVPTPTGSWTRNGIEYRLLPRDFDPEALFEFNKLHGSTPHNFIPDEPVRAHFNKVATGETLVWGAFDQSSGELVGFISGQSNGGYWTNTGPTPSNSSTCFINEFVVNPSYRGKRIGVNLTSISVDPELGIFGVRPDVKEMYTTVHEGNVTSRTAFVKGGYREVITYADPPRDRNTTVLKFTPDSTQYPRGNSQTMRVVGVQSGNAVDGIDVGIFDFEPLVRDPSDPRRLAGSIKYTTIANKTFPFTPEERQYVLGLRAMRLENGNEYAEGNYKFGEWCAKRVNDLIAETGVPKDSISLIGSHGQTVSGHPHWEFGDLSVIAQQTGITVAGDFRPADVAAGGNGTPCTCTYDSIMLRPEAGSSKWRIGINIGGTSSVTFCPPWPAKGEPEEHVPIGLDPGLGVFFMDLTVQAIDPTLDFDDDGKIARSGKVNEELLAHFLTNKYYQQSELPIGVGPDDFPETLWREWHALAQSKGVSDVDLLATFTELTAKQIAMACSRFGGPHIVDGATDDVLLRGGVCNNSYFVERLKANFEEQLGVKIDRIKTLDEDLGINEDSWENAMYAMFGYLCYNNVYNFVPSCTGAARPVVGGRIAPGENFHSVRLSDTPM